MNRSRVRFLDFKDIIHQEFCDKVYHVSTVSEDCCAWEKILNEEKLKLNVALRQCAGSYFVPYMQISSKTSHFRCAPSISRLFLISQFKSTLETGNTEEQIVYGYKLVKTLI